MVRHDTLAAVDLGSNSFHLQIGRVVDGQIYPLDAVREVVRLGAGLTAEKRIDRASEAAALEALAKFAERLRGFPRPAVRAVGTNALRVAKNAPAFLREARAVLGFPIEVISGREEARLIYLGVAHALPPSEDRRFVIDVGGGSTELIVGTRAVEAVRSLDVGCVRITEKHLASDPPAPEELSNAIAEVTDEFDELFRAVPAMREARTVVGLAGTVTTVAAIELGLAEWDRDAIHHFRLTRAAAEDVFRTLATEPLADRVHNPGLEHARADVIVGGCCVLVALFRTLGLDELLVSESDILDGLVFSLAERLDR